MKTITFKTLSILLAAVLLVVALPVTAFAEDVSPCAIPSCEHTNTEFRIIESYMHVTNEEHLVTLRLFEICSRCEKVISREEMDSWLEPHTIDPSVDQECEMDGPCIYCGETIYW
ncbi:MAG: hypothetical protein J6S14_05125 [Clostridia bacterium]|nr:hypothetical protein [Clostridia bacterium]